jgi:hypothetical protein
MKPLRGLKFSSKDFGLTRLRKNLAAHTQAERCPPSNFKARGGADETRSPLLVSAALPFGAPNSVPRLGVIRRNS